MAIRVRSAALVAVLVCGYAIAAIAGGGTGASPSPAPPAVPPSDLVPGPQRHGAELSKKLEAALAALGPKYVPRTEHRLPDGRPRFTNRLILENSPYLRQHAHNPVDWYPWAPEAFERARREDKPIFLSIGYSTCHWCHVMERESFDDEEIARQMNASFISIKVDREQRPDLDDIYMTAVQMISRHGGWPMSSFLTPEALPFFGGTYYPPQQFRSLLRSVAETWRSRKAAVVEQARQVADAVTRATQARGPASTVDEKAIASAIQQALGRHDAQRGGFSRAPKFPHETDLLLLLDHVLGTGDERAMAAVETTLRAMARGGIHDHVGGGFHRYSTDDRWLVPHFEKMLYNQALLSRCYLKAYQLTADREYERVARQTLDYVLRDMTSPEGAFYSATDADSEGQEGRFFVWKPDEIRAALPAEDAALAIELFGATAAGNFEGRNILHLAKSLEDHASQRGVAIDELVRRVDAIRNALYVVRELREHPLRDEKILTAWNGMMITAFAEAFLVLGDRNYAGAARRAAEFLWTHNRRGPGELWRVQLAGSSSIPATQEDFAYLAEGLLALQEATPEAVWLDRAREVADGMLHGFWDEESGGFFLSGRGVDPHLIARPKSPFDGATPSGNSVAVRALARLGALTGERLYRDRATATVGAFSASVTRSPAEHSYMLIGASALRGGEAGPREVAAQGNVAVAASMVSTSPGTGRLAVRLDLRRGWHVNAHRPLQVALVPTVVSVQATRGPWRLGPVGYPAPRTIRLEFQKEPLAVYENHVELSADLSWDPGSLARSPVVPVFVKLQACSDRTCLLPEDVRLELPVAVLLAPK